MSQRRSQETKRHGTVGGRREAHGIRDAKDQKQKSSCSKRWLKCPIRPRILPLVDAPCPAPHLRAYGMYVRPTTLMEMTTLTRFDADGGKKVVFASQVATDHSKRAISEDWNQRNCGSYSVSMRLAKIGIKNPRSSYCRMRYTKVGYKSNGSHY
jgi:hypothetical protein